MDQFYRGPDGRRFLLSVQEIRTAITVLLPGSSTRQALIGARLRSLPIVGLLHAQEEWLCHTYPGVGWLQKYYCSYCLSLRFPLDIAIAIRIITTLKILLLLLLLLLLLQAAAAAYTSYKWLKYSGDLQLQTEPGHFARPGACPTGE